ncbi:MAG: four helix bundle protein [Bacteroidales bacterium]|jgi:four helix bundle protein|nr:four helix bundle protein [Bacteroidales bacterium]
MENQKSTSFFRFEDLRVYHKALEYADWVVEQSKSIDNPAKKMLFKPLLKSAMNISFNIVEGASCNRNSFPDYLKCAKTAVRECYVISSLIRRSGYITEENFDSSKEHLYEITRMLGAMISSLVRQNSGQNPANRPIKKETPSTEESTPSIDIDFESL